MTEIKRLIRESILSQLDFVEEAKKDRFILTNTHLSDSQKTEIIELLGNKPHIEDKILEIIKDWNRFSKFTYDELKPALEYTSHSEKKRRVKSMGIDGLKVGTDYIPVDFDFDPNYKNPDNLELEGAYIPLNWRASRLIASSAIGGVEGEWCIAYQKTEDFWKQYAYGTGNPKPYFADSPSVFIMVIYKGDKFAIQTCPKYNYIVWDRTDKIKGDEHDTVPGINIDNEVLRASKLISKVRQHLDDNPPVADLSTTDGKHIMSFPETAAFNTTNFRSYNLDKANFDKLSLEHKTNFDDCDFSGMSLCDIAWPTKTCNNINFNDTKLDWAIFRYSIFRNSSFKKSNMSMGKFSQAQLTNCDYSNSKIDKTSLHMTIFENVDLTNTTFYECGFDNSSIYDCNVSGTKFINCGFTDRSLLHSDLSNTTISNCDFMSSINMKRLINYDDSQQAVKNLRALFENKNNFVPSHLLELLPIANQWMEKDIFDKILSYIEIDKLIGYDIRSAIKSVFTTYCEDYTNDIKPYMDSLISHGLGYVVAEVFSYDDTVKYANKVLFSLPTDETINYLKDLSELYDKQSRYIALTYLWSKWVKDGGDATNIELFNAVIRYDQSENKAMYIADVVSEMSDAQVISMIDSVGDSDTYSSIVGLRNVVRALADPEEAGRPKIIEYILTKFKEMGPELISKRTISWLVDQGDEEVINVLKKYGLIGETNE